MKIKDLEIFCSGGIDLDTSKVDEVFGWGVMNYPSDLDLKTYWVSGKSKEGVYSENIFFENGDLIYYREAHCIPSPDALEGINGDEFLEWHQLLQGCRKSFASKMYKILEVMHADPVDEE
jgi:hypothetical protein